MIRSMSSLSRGAFLVGFLCALLPALPARAQSDLHRAIPPSGRVLIFIYRVDGDAATPSVPVVVNREPVGDLASGTFVTATVDPGGTELRIGQRLVRTLTFTAAANQSYFVRVQALDDRTPARVDAQSVGEPDGRMAIARSRHVGSAPVVVIPPARIPPSAVPPVAVAPAPPPPVAVAPAVVTPLPVEVPAVVTPPVAAPAPAPAPPPEPRVAKPVPAAPAPAEPRRESQFALIANAGRFKLSNERQTIAGFPSTYDTTSDSVFGVELEWRSGSGFAVGGEFFTYKNDLVSTAPIPNAQQQVYAIMANAKYYFHAADWLYPFVGVGVGSASASYSGGLTGSASGFAYQALAGVEFRFKPVGLLVQYKYLSAETGDAGNDVKIGGKGVFAGISINF